MVYTLADKGFASVLSPTIDHPAGVASDGDSLNRGLHLTDGQEDTMLGVAGIPVSDLYARDRPNMVSCIDYQKLMLKRCYGLARIET